MELAGLVVGLGNPGQQYAGTRHNCGFAFIDALLADCQKISQVEKMGGQKFFCELWRSRLPDNMGTWLCAKPQTFMNESRFKLGGGNAGHNGLRSIEQYIGSNAYYRLRIGIGKPAHKGETLGWVLGRAPGAEQTIFSHAIHNSVEVFYTFAKDGFKAAAVKAKQFGKPEKTPTGEDKK